MFLILQGIEGPVGEKGNPGTMGRTGKPVSVIIMTCKHTQMHVGPASSMYIIM